MARKGTPQHRKEQQQEARAARQQRQAARAAKTKQRASVDRRADTEADEETARRTRGTAEEDEFSRARRRSTSRPVQGRRSAAEETGSADNTLQFPARGAAQFEDAADAQQDHAPVYDQYNGEMPAREPRRKARPQKKARRLTKAEIRRRKIRRRLTSLFLVGAVIVLGVLLSVLVLFKVSAIEIQNADGSTPADTGAYTEDEIIAMLGVSEGDNLFGFRTGAEEERLELAFPLLENIRVKRRLPGTVVVRVTPAHEAYCIAANGSYAILSDSLKVIDVREARPDLPELLLGEIEVPRVGSDIVAVASVPDPTATPDPAASGTDAASEETAEETGDNAIERMNELLTALDTAGLLDGMTELDVSDAEEISFIYQDRVRVELGTVNSLDYKLKFTAVLLFNETGDLLSSTDTGVLDCSHLLSDGTIKPTFAWGDPHAADPTPEPEVTEDETAEEGTEDGTEEGTADAAAETPAAG